MHILGKKKGSIFFLHLYYFYCSGMPRVLSQTCCLLFLTLPSGNQILHIFCGAVQQGGNLLLLLTDSSGLMQTDSSEKRDAMGFVASALQFRGKLWLCVLHSLGWTEKVLVTPASQVMSKQGLNCGKVFSELILLWTLVSIWHSYWVAECAFDNNLLFVNPRKAEVNSTEQAQTKTD